MRRAIISAVAVAIYAACKPNIPEGTFGCATSAECPRMMVCRSDNLCWLTPDEPPDASEPIARDAEPAADAIETFPDAMEPPPPLPDAEVMDARPRDALPSPDAMPPDTGGPCPDGCDDKVDCTVDSCDPFEGCKHLANDGLCPDERLVCNPKHGCMISGCSDPTCQLIECFDVTCPNDICTRVSQCTATQSCCRAQCVNMGCDDGNDCTQDLCGGNGCEHIPVSNSCDDMIYCNGDDACDMFGQCTMHSGDPCAIGALTCNEAMKICQ